MTTAAAIDRRPELDPVTPEERASWALRARVLQELTLLARFAPTIYGRAFDANRSAAGDGGAVEHEAHRQRARERAFAVHRKLEAMRVGDGRLHYAVLWHVFVEHGGAVEPGALGIAFASRVQRTAWKAKRKSVASAAPIKYGERLLSAALGAYGAL